MLARSGAPEAPAPPEAEVSQAVARTRGSDARVSLGVPELDEMLAGGLMPHRPYLVVGPAGTGKTTLGLQFLCEGVRRGERVLYVTLEDPPNEVRWNHRTLRPELDAVEVFDAIPDVMRYERVPFKDISAVRQVVPFGQIPDRIRLTPEFSSVEVTGTALEQMLRSEVQKRGYVRLVIDSLTALQYFCMKGFDPTVGAQTFLRFLTELRTTTLLTVEAPLEDVESPERMLARGEIRLFRWELDGSTVRAVGVEKFRGSSHDVRLHPYRIGARGIDVQLSHTISRDTRRIVEPALEVALRGESPRVSPAPVEAVTKVPAAVSTEPLSEQIRDLVTLGVNISPLRGEVEAALVAARASRTNEVRARLARITAMVISLAPLEEAAPFGAGAGPAARALQRAATRADQSREGEPPTRLPPAELLVGELATILAMVPAPGTAPPAHAAPAAGPPPAAAPSRAPSPGAAPATGAPAPPPSPPPALPPIATAPAVSPREAPAGPTGPPAMPASPSPEAIAKATTLLGEPIAMPSAGSGADSPGLQATAGRRPARSVAPLPAPPPLPTVVSRPTTPTRPTPGAPPAVAPVPAPTPGPRPTAPAPVAVVHAGAGTPTEVPLAPLPAPGLTSAPRRRRRPSAAKVAAATPPVAPGSPDASAQEAPHATVKPKRRLVRRRKAPPVVAAAVEAGPAEAPPPAAETPPSAPNPTTSSPGAP
jgi:KaiC/GvpD/RAD55 family RecA-like ATPase